MSAPSFPVNNIQVSEKIHLRPLLPEDAADIFHTIDRQREYLGEWLPFVQYTKEQKDTEGFIHSVLDTGQEFREKVFVIRYEDRFAGLVSLKNTDLQNKRTEIGYWLSFPFQKKGIATRAVDSLMQLAYLQLGINRVQIRCATGNLPSKNIPKRLGFRFEGIEREGEWISPGRYTDIEVYSLLKKEYGERTRPEVPMYTEENSFQTKHPKDTQE